MFNPIRIFKNVLGLIAFIKFIRNYGPDFASIYSRDMEFEDVCSQAIRRYIEEMTILLPIRYRFILDLLEREGILSSSDTIYYKGAINITVNRARSFYMTTNDEMVKAHETVSFPWKDSPSILERLSPKLRDKIQRFEHDITLMWASAKGFHYAL